METEKVKIYLNKDRHGRVVEWWYSRNSAEFWRKAYGGTVHQKTLYLKQYLSIPEQIKWYLKDYNKGLTRPIVDTIQIERWFHRTLWHNARITIYRTIPANGFGRSKSYYTNPERARKLLNGLIDSDTWMVINNTTDEQTYSEWLFGRTRA